MTRDGPKQRQGAEFKNEDGEALPAAARENKPFTAVSSEPDYGPPHAQAFRECDEAPCAMQSLMNTSRLWRTICLPLWWRQVDCECATNNTLERLAALLTEDPAKSQAVFWLWVRTVLDDDEKDITPASLVRLKPRGHLVPTLIQLCSNLQEIDTDYTERAQKTLFAALTSHADTLTSLTIANNTRSGTPELWASRLVSQLPNLCFVRFDAVDAAFHQLEDKRSLGQALASLTKLNTLQLWECAPATSDWALLDWKTPALRSLALDQCDRISDEGLDALLARFAGTLVELELDLTPLGRSGFGAPLEKISGDRPAPPYHLPQLENLILGVMNCTPAWIDRFSQCPRLCRLQFEELENCGLGLFADLPQTEEATAAFMHMLEDTTKWKAMEKIMWDNTERNTNVDSRLFLVCERRGWIFGRGEYDSDDDDDDEDTTSSSSDRSWEDTDTDASMEGDEEDQTAEE